MQTYTIKRICDLKAGDIVAMHGGTFEILADAVESNAHRPRSDNLTIAHGPADCGRAMSKCLTGEVRGYFKPGSDWTFQGSTAVRVSVII